jgi:uncharacterized protein with FMN-binding domain
VHKAVPAAAASAALVLPWTNVAVAATKAPEVKKKVLVVTKKVTGAPGQADQWGNVQVTLVVKKTTTIVGKKKRIARKITNVSVPVYPNHTDRSVFINQQAIPLLTQEVLKAGITMSNLQLVSGATATSYGFANSLQDALLRAKKI